jgi:competence CoiA-like predicted nuclease
LITIESAYYNGDLWCVYDLKDDKGNYFEDYRLDMRKESQNNKFVCPECGEHLILCAGPIMEPYFKHHENSNCVIRSVSGGTRYFLGRRLLYQLAKKSFPEAKILLNHKLNDHFRSGIYIDNGDQVLSVEYLSSDMKLAEWEEKHNYFLDNNITDIWILSNKKYKMDHLQTFEYLISTNSSPIIKILDENNEKIILKINLFIHEIKRTRLLYQNYPINELSILPEGEFDCDFYHNCIREIDTINDLFKEDRMKKEQMKKEEMKKEEIKKEQMKREQKELQPASYKKKTIEPFVQLSLNDIVYQSNCTENNPEMISNPDEMKYMFNREDKVTNKNQKDEIVVREKLNEDIVMNHKKMKMIHINEVWELPDLIGKDYEVKKANANRYSYLKKMDKELGTLLGDERENRINSILEYLKERLSANIWNYGKSK